MLTEESRDSSLSIPAGMIIMAGELHVRASAPRMVLRRRAAGRLATTTGAWSADRLPRPTPVAA
jgi:hypothetical protein